MAIMRQLATNWWLGIWHIEQSLDDLIGKGRHLLTEEWGDLKTESRQREWLASRLLIEELLAEQGLAFLGLEKDQYNKPALKDQQAHISLSHTKELAVACMHPFLRVGIDVEYNSPRVMRISNKFLSDDEKLCTNGSIDRTLAYWCAKEALYKLYGKKGLSFKDELLVSPTPSQNSLLGKVRTEAEMISASLVIQKHGSHTIVCALEQ